ncbi:MAG: OmpA family protein [Prolixibacteraceae bacterium]|nr:OmpA family protein [Prolixibacteraceae bacterium]
MKRLILFIMIFVPVLLQAQSNCDFFDNTTVEIGKTTINTKASDFGPSFVNNELWHSAFTGKEIDKISRGVTKDVFYDIYISPVDQAGNITGSQKFGLEAISEGYHAGPVSYCQATKELFVTLSNTKNVDIKNKVFQRADIRLRIVVLKEVNGEWEEVSELPFNSAAYSVGHPAISTTGDTLFFAANVPESGEGKTDIYLSVRKNGQWGKMVNLGKNINTAGEDMFPFFFQNNMLIFASDGRDGGKGGLDLYYSCLTENGFSSPKSLGEFNTEYDDFGLVIHPKKQVGYFTSKRPGGVGDDDIYKVVFTPKLMVSGKVVNDATDAAIAGAMVVVADCDGNRIASSTSGSGGEFSFKLEPADCLKLKASKVPFHDEEQKVVAKYTILRLKGDYKLELLVQDKNSHQPVANSPVRFNDKTNLVKTGDNGMIERDLDRNKEYLATTELDGYMNQSVAFSTVKQPYGTIRKIINIEKVKVGQKFTLENIYYNFDKWDILPESEIELDKLVKVMNDNPAWKVELGSHTDCRGSDAYNKVLSQKRSDSAVSYIVSKGIAKDRIIAKGYGESQLLNKCDDGVPCTEAEHRLNRRTEFKILKIE